MTFQELNLNKHLQNALDDLGFKNPTTIQEKVFSVAKSGKDSFYFPIGDGRRWCPAAISTPSVISDFFAAYYNFDPSSTLLPVGAPFSRTSHALDVPKISDKEYWHIEGPTSVRITLAWDEQSNIATLTDNDLQRLIVTGWDGQKWVNLGAVSITGTLQAGRITSRMVHGQARAEDAALLKSVADQIPGRTICAFGEACSWPTQSFIAKFGDEFKAYPETRKSVKPAGTFKLV